MSTAKIVKLREVDGVICASSRDIARDFKKRHDHVLNDITRIVDGIKSEPRNLGALNWFRVDTYFSEQQKPLPCWDMTEEGFALVVGRYTGKDPLAWQIAYHTEFQRMKALLGRAGAPAAHALFKPNEHRDNVVAFQGPPKPQADLFPPPVTEKFPYRYHRDYADAEARNDEPPRHTQAEWNDLPLAAKQEWWEKYASAVQLKNYNDDLLCGQSGPDETRTHERIGGDRWTDHHEGLRYQVINDFNSAAQRRLWITCNYRGEIHEYPTVAPDGSYLLVCLNEPFAPLEVIERNYDKLGRGPSGAIGKATLRHDLY